MAVFGGFFKAVLFISFILSIVSSVLPAECDNLLLALNGDVYNQTEFLIPPNVRNRKIRCGCSDSTHTVKWFFNNGTEVPPLENKSQTQVYSKVRAKAKEGSNLLIPRDASPLEYVGGYRCESDGSNASTNIVVKDPSIEVTLSPAATEVIVKDGTESVMLLCSITVVSGGTVEWTRNGANINNSVPRHTVETDDSSSRLQIKNLTKNDEGSYQCVYDMSGANFSSNQAVVFITGLIQVSIEPSDSVAVEVSTEGRLNCVANGYQADMFMYQWRLNGTDINDATDKTLVISSATESDGGRYECTVTNHWGETASNSTELIVTRNLPFISTDPMDVMVTLHHGNEIAVFSCEANGGSNDIQYRWFAKTSDGDMMLEGETSNTLMLSQITVEMNNTQFYCVASNNSGNVTSGSAHLTVTTFIQANIQPAGDIVEVGTMATFECVAEGYQSKTFKYQWRRNNNDISDSNNKTLILTSVTEDHSGSYECVVTNDWNVTATSPPAMLTIRNNPPVISTDPKDVTISLRHGNESAVFSCEANGGSSDIQYRWFNKTSDGDMMLEGQTSNTLMLSPVTVEMNNTQFYCVASNNSGNVTSGSARLTVTTFIQANIQPAGDTVEVGTMATFECVAEGYQSETFKYQWRRNNNDIRDSNNKTLILTSVTEDHSGSYECVVTNDWNVTATSPPAMLTIRSNPPVISTDPMDVIVLLRHGNESAVFSCEANGGSSDIQYRWFNKTSDGDMMLEGQTSNMLMLSPVTVEMNNTQFYCIASNNGGSDTSESAHLTVTTFIQANIQPAGDTVEVGTMVTFECVAEGYQSETFKYQWRHDNSDITDSNNKILILTSVTEDHSGSYECVVTNDWNVTATSPPVMLTVTRNLPVITTHPMNATVSLRHGNESAVFSCEANGGSSDIQYRWFTKTSDGDMMLEGETSNTLMLSPVTVKMNNTQYYCVASNNSGNITSETGHLTVDFDIGPPVIVTHPPDVMHFVVNSSSDKLTLNCIAKGEGVVYWQKDGVDIDGSEMPIVPDGNTLDIVPDKITDTNVGMYRCIASNVAGLVMSNSTSVTVTGDIQVTIEQSDLSAEVTTAVHFTCKADGYQSDTFRYQWRLNQDDIDGATDKTYIISSVNETDRGMYECVVTNHWNEEDTSDPVQLNVTRNLPVIIMGPQNLTVLIENDNPGKVEFSCVTEEGADHKWITIVQGKHNNRKTPLNKTHSVCHVNINLSHNGTQVYCEATNGSGTVRSQIATLTILVPPPVITEHPEVLVNATVGDTVMFQCTARSFGKSQALQYYWLKIVDNNTTIPIYSVTANILQFIAVAEDDSTYYQCAATNENGTVFSNVGRLHLLPSITVQPENIYVQHNVSITLHCEAVGGNDINYKWTRNNGTIVQDYSNHGNLIIESVQKSDEGAYQCEAVNDRGEVALSEQAEIVIYDKFLLDINVTDAEHYVLQGSDAYISCAVNIQPSPLGGINISWYKESTDDDLSSVSELVEINDTSYLILHLQNIEKEDKGTYVCSVDDGHVEGGINISTNLIVEYPPTITKFPEVGPFRIGDPLHVFCSASGIPSPTVTLFINDKETFRGRLSVAYNVTSATIKNDHGTYECVASSNSKATGQPFATASKSIEVLVQGVPDRIKRTKIQYNPINLTAINLIWTKPFDSNSPITNYTVSCDKCPTRSSTVYINVTVIGGLTPGVEYKLNIAAVNVFGRGSDSPTVTAQSATPESTAVTNLDAVAVNEVSVRVAWMDPQLYAPMIKEYTVHAVSNDHDKIITIPAGQRNATITDLVPTFTYNVSVVVTYNVASFMSDPTMHSVTVLECEACVKPEIVQPTSKNLTDLSFTLKWLPIDTGLLQSYTLFYTSRMISQLPVGKRQIENEINIPVHSTNYTVKDLMPFSSYCFSLQASYAQEDVVFSNDQSDAICNINTPPLASSAPINLKIDDVDFTSVTISWSSPSERHGIIIRYKVYYSSVGVNKSQLTENADNLEYQITALTPGTPYSISVAAITYHPYRDDGLEGPQSSTVDVSTSFAAPMVVSQPSTVGSSDLEQLTAVITVPTIDESLGEMSHYLVVVVIGELPSEFTTPRDIPDNQLLPYNEATGRGYNYYVATGGQLANTSHILGNEENRTIGSIEYYNARLTPDQQYSYFVRAYSKHNSTTYSTSGLSPHFVLASDDEETSSPLGIIIGAVAIVLVIIIILLILVILLVIRIQSAKNTTTNEAPLRDLPSPSKEHKPISAAPGFERKLSVPFIGTQSVDIYTSVGPPTTLSIEVGGKPLPEVQWFKDDNPVVHRVLSDGSLYIEKTSIGDGGKYTARVTNAAGKSEESIHVTVIEPSPPEDDPEHPAIRVEDFAQHVALNRSNMEERSIEEYRDLEVEQSFSQHNARIPVNRNKNRYINIIPYDHSRVTLETDYQVTGSDYINASYIDGYFRPGEYIATQGPLASTFGDFWKMIWEKRCTTIVMLTNLNEDDKIKCHQYWPSYGSAMYDNFRVTLKSVETLAEYSIRVFTVEQISNGNHALEVHQFHYTVWPDHGVPECGTPLLSFHSRVEKFFKRDSAPMVIHCSAGVGRTGTFIVIDTQMQRIRDQSNIDIFNNVRRLRFCRNYMVQTQSQYCFLHDVMLEAIMCGDTSLGAPVQNIVDRLRDLAAVDPDTKETLFTKQFKILDSDVLQEKKFTYTVATAPKNAARNRYQNHLAADQNFVYLPTTDDKPGYINASFVDGYRMRNAFIVTQGPLENTIEDFWEMIWEYKSHAIVMLTPLEENEKEQCCQYWPDEGTKEYGSYVVEAMRFYEPIGGEFKREFKLSHVSKPMESRVITQFHFVNWPEDSCPDNSACIIDLIDSVERVQRKTGNGPITVHCNDGIGRSGTFCALVSSLERFKAEQMADIFQTIKKMRMQRAGIVQTPEQYEFLHKALLEAIERFDTYSNFT